MQAKPRPGRRTSNLRARVEYFDSDGAGYITIFAGQSANVRARDYYDAIEHGTLNTRIADAQVVTAKQVV